MRAVSRIIDEKAEAELRRVFGNLVSPVKLVLFTQENACPACAQQRLLIEELVALSSKLGLKVYDFVLHGDEALSYKVDKIPATAVVGRRDYGIRFYGLTAGYEFASLLEAIVMVSTGRSGLDSQLEALVKQVKEQVHIQVYITLTCPYCPRMVHVAHQFAFVNDKIRGDMVEASEYPHLVQRYGVSAVPKTVINETHYFEGALPAAAAYLEVLKAVSPEEYGRIDEAAREAEGMRRVQAAKEDHEYEVIIVGGGPSAMSAAVYAARKGLDVAMIARKLGGQVSDTASVENYLGLSGISGADMTEAFRNHVETYPVAEVLGVNVVEVKKADRGFIVFTDDNRRFRASSLLYCAGKEYRRLGIPGEERFIGKGIGFCATCDAPLYRDKRVAIVGGGNAAFTAARDLLGFASEVHLIHRRKQFKADEALVKEVLNAKNVVLHTPTVVRSFFGENKLAGLTLESVDSKDKFDLKVDGVFLEIGLTPNSDPLKGLLQLNERGEVPVNKDQSTSVAGLFAAGDVTDVEEKQIVIAVGQGALAALSAHKYLTRSGLTKSKISLRESWQ
jgi:alkyl hydroperoxide reductase subunit F